MSEAAPLWSAYDVALFDLDGVVYAGSASIPHAAEAVAASRAAGMRAAFVTNNASRTPSQVVDKLAAAGVTAQADEIITSAQVAAEALASRLPPGARVLLVGDVGLEQELLRVGLEPVSEVDPVPAAVVQGFSPRTGWPLLCDAVYAVRAGALWVATNLDSTIPSERGIMPGNGAFVDVIAHTLGRRPDVVAGKPDQWMHRVSVRRTGADRPLVVGDRLDTDIEGAVNAGCDSLLVLTGVATPADVVHAPPEHRPTYLGLDLRSLGKPGRSPAAVRDGRIGPWQAAEDGVITGYGSPASASAVSSTLSTDDPDDDIDLLALACSLQWSGATPVAGDDRAAAGLQRLGLR